MTNTLETALVDGSVDFFELVSLDGDKGDIPNVLPGLAHDLIVPNDLVNGKGNILLGLEADDGVHLAWS